jgi:hypothetical protein
MATRKQSTMNKRRKIRGGWTVKSKKAKGYKNTKKRR